MDMKHFGWLVRQTVDPRTSQPAPVLVLPYRYRLRQGTPHTVRE